MSLITITIGQAVPNSNHITAVGGEFQPADLVECALPDAPDVSICAYQANYIATGEFA